MSTGFTLDVCASADAGWDVYEGPIESREGVDVFAVRNGNEQPEICIDCRQSGILQLPLDTARVLSDALETLLKRI